MNTHSLVAIICINITELSPITVPNQNRRQQPRLSKSLDVGIRPDMQYTLETEVFEELHDRRPIVIDPTLVRAAQLADIHLLNEAKERGNDLKFLLQMYFGLEEGFNKLLRSRVLSAKSSSAE